MKQLTFFKSALLIFPFVFGTISLPTLNAQSTQNAPKINPQEAIPLIPRSVLFGNPQKASPQLSPDGTKLAYVAPDNNQVLNVWIKDLAKKENDQMITNDKKRGVRSYFWQLDNQHIIYAQDRDGDENWHIYQTDINTKATRDLTPKEGVRADILAYEPEHPNTMLVQMNLRNPALFDVYRLNLTTGALELDTENPDNVHQWLADNNLQVRAAQSYDKNGDTIIRIRENGKSPWKEFLRWGPEENEGDLVSFSPDGKFLYLISSVGGNTARLIKVNLATKQQEVVSEDPHYDIDTVLIQPTTHKIQGVGIDKDKFEWVILDPSLTADFAKLKEHPGIFRLVSRDLQDNKWIVAYSYDDKPSQFYLYDRNNKQLTFLFTPRPELEKYPLSPMKPISFTAKDGMKIYGYLTLPLGKEPKNLPTVLFVHGGPWTRDSWGLSPSAQWLANRGYAVLQINYRGSTGYGKDYLNAGNKEWAAKMHDDLLDGKQWMVDHGYSDPNKVAIYGGSYGGYAALVGLTFTPEAFCCAVDVVGPSNLVTLLQTVPPYWGPAKTQFDLRVGNLETEKGLLESRSPLFKADKITKPLLIAQGANDPRVKQAESDQIVAAMRKNHQPVEYLLFMDEGHGFVRPENQLKFFAAAEDFLAKYLGGRSQPPSSEENWESLKK